MSTDAQKDELELVRSGDNTVLKDLYRKHRSPFLQWAKRKYAEADAADIYQQAFTIFYFNVKDGKFKGMTSSIKTYIFAIGKNLLNKFVQERKVGLTVVDDVNENELPAETIFDQYEATHRQKVVGSILENIGEPCKTILTQYYYHNFTMESIAERLGYKTAMVAKKKKCDCLARIRASLKEKETSLTRER